MTPLERYTEALDTQQLTPDAQQRAVVLQLTGIHERLCSVPLPTTKKSSALRRMFNRSSKPPPKVGGLYLWGGVGRGKTLLTDMFYDAVPTEHKSRLHFHRYMKSIHDELKLLKGEEDPLIVIADKWINRARLLVLDEIHVHDITDAMLLGRLMSALFERGLTLVTTSNVPPEDLYRDGLQRDRFLPAIEQIKQHTTVFCMEGETDYRLRVLENAHTWFNIDSPGVQTLMQNYFDKLCTHRASVARSPLLINSRELPVILSGDGVVWFEFDALCNTPRSTHDYIEIATVFHTVMISDVPVLDDNRNDAARRLVNLVDELYDRSVNVIVSAQAEPDALYTGTRLQFEFVRAASRLREMQAIEYLARPHLE